jgi:DNA-binding NarL/FixJ family response regulator
MPKLAAGNRKRILVVDDHPGWRAGLRWIFEQTPDLEIAAESDDLESAVKALKENVSDLAIVDLRLRGCSGLEVLDWIRANRPTLRSLVISVYEDELYVEWALEAGALGYLNKSVPTKEIVQAVRRVLAGKLYLSGPSHSRLMAGIGEGRKLRARRPTTELTGRELEVYRLIGKGYNLAEIASTLRMSPETARTHRENARKKLGLEDSIEVAQHAALWMETDGYH